MARPKLTDAKYRQDAREVEAIRRRVARVLAIERRKARERGERFAQLQEWQIRRAALAEWLDRYERRHGLAPLEETRAQTKRFRDWR